MDHQAAATGGRGIVTHQRAAPGRRSRLVRPRRKAVRIAALSVAAALVVELVGLAGWRLYDHWRSGRIELFNDGAPVSVQVLDESGGRPIGEPLEVVARSMLTLPDGEYRLRVDGMGRLGRTYRVAVNRGETIAHRLWLDEGRLLGQYPPPSPTSWQPGLAEEPLPAAGVLGAIELTPGKADLVEWNERSLIRRDGVTGQAIWDTSRPRPVVDRDRDPRRWLDRLRFGGRFIELVRPAVDVDGDGIGDLIIAINDFNAFLAVSGVDGSVLWHHSADVDGPGAPPPPGPDVVGPFQPPERPMQLMGPPAVGDVDRDRVPDLVATILFYESDAEKAARAPGLAPAERQNLPPLMRRLVQAISGRTGRRIWSRDLDQAFRQISNIPGLGLATLVTGRQTSIVAILDGSNWLGLDPATGRPKVGPIDLGLTPAQPPGYVDLDGDGEPEILALGRTASMTAYSRPIAAFSAKTGQPRWSVAITPMNGTGFNPPQGSAWPWLVDLDGDGRSEVVVPDCGPMPPGPGYRGMRVLDGASGRTRWVRPMRPETNAMDGLADVAEAPDFDGDGTRDLIAVWWAQGRNARDSPAPRRPEPDRVHADAISGKDGRLLWAWHRDLPRDVVDASARARWWGRGPDGWPLLAIAVEPWTNSLPEFPSTPPIARPPGVFVLEASSGEERHAVPGLRRVEIADLDGDGLLDLWGAAAGQLRAFRGEPPEAWRALGEHSPADRSPFRGTTAVFPVADLDGDGIVDALASGLDYAPERVDGLTGSRTAIARSGRDGRLLWKTTLDPPAARLGPDPSRSYRLAAFPGPAGDLDGDGTPDVLAEKTSNDEDADARQRATLPIQALSGRDGCHLWSAGLLPLGFEAYGYSQLAWAESRVIEPGSPPDLVVFHLSRFVKGSKSPAPSLFVLPAEPRIARVSGRTGRIVWDIASPPGGPWALPPTVTDLDGDGVLDAVVEVQQLAGGAGAGPSVTVISLRDGRRLWSRPIDSAVGVTMGRQAQVVRRGGDGRALLVVFEIRPAVGGCELLLHALDGRDGSVAWTWRSGPGKVGDHVFGGLGLYDLDGTDETSIRLMLRGGRGETSLVILDPDGRERARRVLPRDFGKSMNFHTALMLDLDGDGRDEMIAWGDRGLLALGHDLRDLWSYPPPVAWPIAQVVPSSPGRPATLILDPMTAIDGSSGKAIWRGSSAGAGVIRLLDPGDSSRRPLLVNFGQGPTVCRRMPPAAPRGGYEPPSGALVPPGVALDDPRWTRPWPWIAPIRDLVTFERVAGVTALALVNVVVPLGLLRLAARRRPWTLRLLMALPVAAALPLWVFPNVELLLPSKLGTQPIPPRLAFFGGTLAGLPIVVYAGFVVLNLARRRWKRLAWPFGLALAAAAIIAAAWLRIDLRTMPSIEHYGRSGWHLVAVPGVYAGGILLLLGWILMRPYRWLKRPRRPEVGTS